LDAIADLAGAQLHRASIQQSREQNRLAVLGAIARSDLVVGQAVEQTAVDDLDPDRDVLP